MNVPLIVTSPSTVIVLARPRRVPPTSRSRATSIGALAMAPVSRMPPVTVRSRSTVRPLPSVAVPLVTIRSVKDIPLDCIVPPVRTTRLVPASTVPLVYVQLRPVRMVPTRSSVPEGLSMTRLGSAPAPGTAVAEPVNVWSSVPSMRMVPVPAPALAAWLIGPRAAMVPEVERTADEVERAVHGGRIATLPR